MQSSNSESGARMNVSVVENKDGAVLYLSGRVVIDSSPAFRDRLLALLKSGGQRRVSVDLSAVTNIDSSAVATLIEALKIAHAHKTELRLQGLHDDLLRLFEFTGILPLFNGSSQAVSQSGSEVV